MRREKRSPDRDPAWLLDMLHAAEAAVSFVDGKSFEEYQTSLLLRSAVERQVGIVGECVRAISDETKDAHPEVPWFKIEGARHRLVHDYYQVDDAVVWAVATIHLVSLIPQLKAILPPIPDLPNEPN